VARGRDSPREATELSIVLSISVLTALVAGLLLLIGFAQPAAERLHLPYTVLLAIVGTAVASLASFLLYTPLTNVFNDIAEPLVKFPISASVFLVVFLPLLLFHAALTIDVRELVDDVAPILTLAVLAVFVSAGGIGLALSFFGGVPLAIALLLGSIVATTDPAAVVGIFRNLGVPSRLVRLVEGESLLNDAAAIVLFSTLVRVTSGEARPDLLQSAIHFGESFGGGLLLGFVGGRLFGALLPLLGGSKLAEVTFALALPYLVYLIGEDVFEVSGVVAVVGAGLTVGAIARTRLTPDNWDYLEQVWEQIGFWANSLIFIMASLLVPRLLTSVNIHDLWLLALVIVSAFAARAAVLFGVLPILEALKLSRPIEAAYKVAITWGGLRGAVTLALALAVTESARIDAAAQSLVAVLATGFVLFTLLVNGLTLQLVMRWLKLDRLSPINNALRSKVLALALAEVRSAVAQTSQNFELAPDVAEAVIADLTTSRTANELDHQARNISERDGIAVGLIALTNRERRIILTHHAQQSVSGVAIERLLRETDLLIDAAKTYGAPGYARVAVALLAYSPAFRFAHFFHRHLTIEYLLQQAISVRFEILLVREFALKELLRYNKQWLPPLLSESIARDLEQILTVRLEATTRAIEALKLQYPEYAAALERHFLMQTGLTMEMSLIRQLAKDGVIGGELHNALEREHAHERRKSSERMLLDLGLRTEDLIPRFDMFRGLESAEIKALARLFKSRLALPEEKIVRRGERGAQMFFISSGAVEVALPGRPVRLGRGDFFGEMALLSGLPRTADVVALGYCQLLVLGAADFQGFLAAYPQVKAHIDQAATNRTSMNEENAEI
jgi:monovalent cation:H+ antiporter, CPA1 family